MYFDYDKVVNSTGQQEYTLRIDSASAKGDSESWNTVCYIELTGQAPDFEDSDQMDDLLIDCANLGIIQAYKWGDSGQAFVNAPSIRFIAFDDEWNTTLYRVYQSGGLDC